MTSDMEERTELTEEEERELLAAEAEEQPAEVIPPRFVVKTTLNAQLQLEASTALAPKSAKWLTYICLVLVAAMAGFCVYVYVTTRSSTYLFYSVLMLMVGAFLAYQKFLMPKVSLKKWEQSMLARYGTRELHLTLEFFEHSLAQSVEELDDVEQEGYSALSRIVETEHLILIKRNRTLWFFLEKSGFTVGRAEDFLPFLQEKIGG